jgi:hypothetical protein
MSTPQDTINLTIPELGTPLLAPNRYTASTVGGEQARAAGSEEGTLVRAPLRSPGRVPPVVIVKEEG